MQAHARTQTHRNFSFDENIHVENTLYLMYSENYHCHKDKTHRMLHVFTLQSEIIK